MIKIYSDKTNKFYNSVEEANRAEFELKEKENREKIQKERELALAKEKKEKALAERKAAAEGVEAARKNYLEAQKAYRKVLEDFCGKYGTYHYSTNSAEEIPSLFDIFDNLFKF
jgi:hypothetical protein